MLFKNSEQYDERIEQLSWVLGAFRELSMLIAASIFYIIYSHWCTFDRQSESFSNPRRSVLLHVLQMQELRLWQGWVPGQGLSACAAAGFATTIHTCHMPGTVLDKDLHSVARRRTGWLSDKHRNNPGPMNALLLTGRVGILKGKSYQCCCLD